MRAVWNIRIAFERFDVVQRISPTLSHVSNSRKMRSYSARSEKRDHMSYLDEYLKRNKDFAAQQSAAGGLMPSLKAAMPNLRGIVITCADPRLDPEKILGIQLGEVVVLRNIGGRVTP